MIQRTSLNEPSHWLSVTQPTKEDMAALVHNYGVTRELLRYALDPYEKARVEIDPEAKVTLFIFDVVLPSHNVSEAETAPIGLMVANKNLLTFTTDKTDFVNDELSARLARLKAAGKKVNCLDFVIGIMYDFTTAYFTPIRHADGERQRLCSVTCKKTWTVQPSLVSWKLKLARSTSCPPLLATFLCCKSLSTGYAIC